MNRLIKYQSNEAGNFTTERNIVSFSIPKADYNLRKSYVELEIGVDGETYAATNHGGCVALFKNNAKGGDIRAAENLSLIRRATFQTQNQLLEDIDRVDLLRNTLSAYTTDMTAQMGESYGKISQSNIFGQPSTIFRDTYQLGTTIARATNAKVQIPLHDFLELGKEREMPLSQMGSSSLKLHLQLDNLRLAPVATDIIGPAGAFTPITAKTIAHTLGAGDTGATYRGPFVFACSEALQQSFTLAGCPFYVGQALTIAKGAGSAAGVGAIDTSNVIEKMERNGANLEITFKFAVMAAAAAWATGELLDLECLITAPTGLPTAKIYTAAIILSEYMAPLPKVNELNFSTFTTELMSTTSSNMYRQTMIEPNAFNIFLMSANNLPISVGTNWTDYRLSVNNTPIINRQATITNTQRNGIHHELLQRAFRNANLPLNNMTEAAQSCDSVSEGANIKAWTANHTTGVKIIASPVPMTNNWKPLLIELNGGGALSNLALYKQVYKTIKM